MADERDRLIMKLRAEVDALSQHERDYSDLNFLLTNLEHRYNLLNEEKYRIEQEFTQRNETNIQTIAMHRADIDQLREELSMQQGHMQRMRGQLEEKLYENEDLIQEVNILRKDNHQLLGKVDFMQQQIQITQNTKALEDVESRGQLQQTLERTRNDNNKLKTQMELVVSENSTLQSELEKAHFEIKKLQHLAKTTKQECDQHLSEIKRTAEEDLKIQKDVLMKNNEHFQLTIENLTQQLEQQHKQKETPLVRESDINRQQLSECIKELQTLKKQLSESEHQAQDLRNEKRNLQQKLEVAEELLEQSKRQLQFLKEELSSTEGERKSRSHQLVELEREITILQQEAQQRDKSFERLRLTTQQEGEYKLLQSDFDVLEHEYKILQKMNQCEVSRVRDLQFSLDCKDRELNRTIKRISELESELRQKNTLFNENEQLKAKVEQQQRQIRKIFEEGHLIKEYLNKKKNLRENRLLNERSVLETLNELINAK